MGTMAAMARYFDSCTDDIDFFKSASTSKNTNRSTTGWMNVYRNWAQYRHFDKEMHMYVPEELNKILEKIYVEIRKIPNFFTKNN